MRQEASCPCKIRAYQLTGFHVKTGNFESKNPNWTSVERVWIQCYSVDAETVETIGTSVALQMWKQ